MFTVIVFVAILLIEAQCPIKSSHVRCSYFFDLAISLLESGVLTLLLCWISSVSLIFELWSEGMCPLLLLQCQASLHKTLGEGSEYNLCLPPPPSLAVFSSFCVFLFSFCVLGGGGGCRGQTRWVCEGKEAHMQGQRGLKGKPHSSYRWGFCLILVTFIVAKNGSTISFQWEEFDICI